MEAGEYYPTLENLSPKGDECQNNHARPLAIHRAPTDKYSLVVPPLPHERESGGEVYSRGVVVSCGGGVATEVGADPACG
jgi:hypothetical protein